MEIPWDDPFGWNQGVFQKSHLSRGSFTHVIYRVSWKHSRRISSKRSIVAQKGWSAWRWWNHHLPFLEGNWQFGPNIKHDSFQKSLEPQLPCKNTTFWASTLLQLTIFNPRNFSKMLRPSRFWSCKNTAETLCWSLWKQVSWVETVPRKKHPRDR